METNNFEAKKDEVIPVKPEILRKETFLKMVENSVGCKLFNSLIMKKDGEVVDILGDDGAAHRHVGFVLNENEAVSTTGILHAAISHPLYKKPGTDIDRKIERVFRVRDDK